jgi:GxxExxY protein
VNRWIEFEREVPIRITFKGRVLPSFYRVDFVCFGEVLVEMKASAQIWPTDLAQMINYLKATRVTGSQRAQFLPPSARGAAR